MVDVRPDGIALVRTCTGTLNVTVGAQATRYVGAPDVVATLTADLLALGQFGRTRIDVMRLAHDRIELVHRRLGE